MQPHVRQLLFSTLPAPLAPYEEPVLVRALEFASYASPVPRVARPLCAVLPWWPALSMVYVALCCNSVCPLRQLWWHAVCHTYHAEQHVCAACSPQASPPPSHASFNHLHASSFTYMLSALRGNYVPNATHIRGVSDIRSVARPGIQALSSSSSAMPLHTCLLQWLAAGSSFVQHSHLQHLVIQGPHWAHLLHLPTLHPCAPDPFAGDQRLHQQLDPQYVERSAAGPKRRVTRITY